MPRTIRSKLNADADDGDAPDVTIFDKDDSVVYLDYPGYENYGKERSGSRCGVARSASGADQEVEKKLIW